MCNTLTYVLIIIIMSDMLKRFYEQLDITMGEIRRAEDRREMLKHNLTKTAADIIDVGYKIDIMQEEASRIRNDIDTLTGT